MAGKVFFFARSPDAPSTTRERQPPATLFDWGGWSNLGFSETASAAFPRAGGAAISAVVPLLKDGQDNHCFLRYCLEVIRRMLMKCTSGSSSSNQTCRIAKYQLVHVTYMVQVKCQSIPICTLLLKRSVHWERQWSSTCVDQCKFSLMSLKPHKDTSHSCVVTGSHISIYSLHVHKTPWMNFKYSHKLATSIVRKRVVTMALSNHFCKAIQGLRETQTLHRGTMFVFQIPTIFQSSQLLLDNKQITDGLRKVLWEPLSCSARTWFLHP